MTAMEAANVTAATAMRDQCTSLESLWYFATRRSSVVYAGGPILGLRPSEENVGEVDEVTWGFWSARGAMTVKVILERQS